ncbi:hypothetical protein ACFX13_004795 [Malus domestica]
MYSAAVVKKRTFGGKCLNVRMKTVVPYVAVEIWVEIEPESEFKLCSGTRKIPANFIILRFASEVDWFVVTIVDNAHDVHGPDNITRAAGAILADGQGNE